MDPKIDPKAYVEPEYYSMVSESDAQYDSEEELKKLIEKIRKAMMAAAKRLEFLEAAQLRDQLIMLESKLKEKEKSASQSTGKEKHKPVDYSRKR